MFLNTLLQGTCGFCHPQLIKWLKLSKNLEKSHRNACELSILWRVSPHGLGNSFETIVTKTVAASVKLRLDQVKHNINPIQTCRLLLQAQAQVEKCLVWRDIEINFTLLLPTNEGKDHPDRYQQNFQKPSSVMVWGCVSAHGLGDIFFSPHLYCTPWNRPALKTSDCVWSCTQFNFQSCNNHHLFPNAFFFIHVAGIKFRRSMFI